MIRIYLDNVAAKQILRRSGVGKVWHLSCRILWTQKLVAEGKVLVHTVPTKTNPADLGTKRLTRARIRFLMFLCGVCNANSGELIGSEFHVLDGSSRINRMADATNVLRTLLLSALSLPARSADVCAADQAAVTSSGGAAGNMHYIIEFVLILGLCIAACMALFYWLAEKTARHELPTISTQRAYFGQDRYIQTEEEEEEDSDDFAENLSAKRLRYLNSTMSQRSEPDMWADLHYGPADMFPGNTPMDTSFDAAAADESRPDDPLVVMDMIMRSDVDSLQLNMPAVQVALREIHRMLREAENHGLSQDETRESLLQAINHRLRQKQLMKTAADGAGATSSMQPAAAAGLPTMDLSTSNSGMDFDQMLQEARRSQMSALVAISQRVLEAEDANDHEAIEYWQGQYDLIHSLM